MDKRSNEAVQLGKAKKRLKRIKQFYRHLSVYLVINIILFGVKVTLYDQLGGGDVASQGFQNSYRLNLWVTPVLWGIGLLIHGLVVFNHLSFSKKSLSPGFIKKWEERQIKKYLEKQDSEDNK